jgi:hypothetical protein
MLINVGPSESKNYDSFKVASNFFLRLRKEDMDLKDSKNKPAIDDGNVSLRMMASRNNLNNNLNVSRMASNGLSQMDPSSGPNLTNLGKAIMEDLRMGSLNNLHDHSGLKRNKGSNMDLPGPKTSNRSLSPFNASVSYYNAI